MRTILTSFGGKATQDQIAQALMPEIFNETEWKRWWDSAKKELKKDGHFSLPAKKGEPILLREEAVSRIDELLAHFASARQLKDQLVALDAIIKNLDAFPDPAPLKPVISAVEEASRKNQKLRAPASIELLLARNEICEKTGLPPGPLAPTLVQMLRDEEKRLGEILPEIGAAKQKRVFAAFPEAFGEEWVPKVLKLLLREPGPRGRGDRPALAGPEPPCGTEARDRPVHPRSLAQHGGPLLAVQGAEYERLQRSHHPLRVQRHHHGPGAGATGRAPARRPHARSHHGRPRADSRAALRRGDRHRARVHAEADPHARIRGAEQALSAGPHRAGLPGNAGHAGRAIPAEKQEALIVSWESLERRKEEYEDLIKKKIPENTREIAIARDYGDLRENFEFKAAKEMQRVLQRRQSEMELALSRARGTDFSNADTNQVSIGTIVTYRALESGQTETYTLLGAWDGEPEKGILSYQSGIGQALLGKKVGDRAELPSEGPPQKVEIISIEAYHAEVAARG